MLPLEQAASAERRLPFDDNVAAARAELGKLPIELTKLTGNITLLTGPGGEVQVLDLPALDENKFANALRRFWRRRV